MSDDDLQVKKRVVYEQTSTSDGRQNLPVIIGVLLVVAILVYFILTRWS